MIIKRWMHVNHITNEMGNICPICYDSSITAFFADCGHTGCKKCLSQLKQCHVCRGPASLKPLFFSGSTEQTTNLPNINESNDDNDNLLNQQAIDSITANDFSNLPFQLNTTESIIITQSQQQQPLKYIFTAILKSILALVQ